MFILDKQRSQKTCSAENGHPDQATNYFHSLHSNTDKSGLSAMTMSALAMSHNCGDQQDCTDPNCQGRQQLNQLRKCLETIRLLQRMSVGKRLANQDEREYMLKQLEVSFQPSEEKSEGAVGLENAAETRRKELKASR